MYRLLHEKLIRWKNNPDKMPLIVQGVPHCGKSHLLKEFGEALYDDVVYINFEEDGHLASIFELNLNPHRIIKDLSLSCDKDIIPHLTLIIFDKVHACNKALESLEHFGKEASEYHIAAISSFCEQALPRVEILTLYPMNFYEFLLAQNSSLANHFRENPFNTEALKTFKAQLEGLFRDYQIVGGMPEVVSCWIDTKSIELVEKLQSRIISGFENDFAKNAPISMFPKLSAIWNAIPAQLAKENRKFIFSRVKKSWRARDLEDALYLLIRAGLVYKVEHVDKPDFPLSSYAGNTHFKLYMCDVGLLRRTAKIPPSVIMDSSNNFKDIKNALVENIVCCELKRIYGQSIYYWSAENPGRAEVEFIIQDGNDIIPIVAKAGSASRTRSLTQYCVRFAPKKSVLTSMDNDKPDVIPLYTFWALKKWLSKGTTG